MWKLFSLPTIVPWFAGACDRCSRKQVGTSAGKLQTVKTLSPKRRSSDQILSSSTLRCPWKRRYGRTDLEKVHSRNAFDSLHILWQSLHHEWARTCRIFRVDLQEWRRKAGNNSTNSAQCCLVQSTCRSSAICQNRGLNGGLQWSPEAQQIRTRCDRQAHDTTPRVLFITKSPEGSCA